MKLSEAIAGGAQVSSRPDNDIYYLNIALAVAQKSSCLRRCYGAVIVTNGQIVATGYNGPPRGEPNCCDVGHCERETLKIPPGERYEACRAGGCHAEINACLHAGRSACVGGTLYLAGFERATGNRLITPQPCLLCARIIKNCGIKEVVS